MKKTTGFALVLFFAALLLRLSGTLQGNFAFTYDIGRDLLAVRDLVLTHKLSFIGPTSGLMGVFYGPWWYWFLAPIFFISGGDPMVMVGWVALVGSLAAAAGYVWGERIGGKILGIILGIILAASPEVVRSTSQLWSPNLLVPATLVVMILIYDVRAAGIARLFFLGFFLAMLTEFEIVYGLIFIVGFFLALLLWHKKIFSRLNLLPFLSGMIVVEIPRILFNVRHGFLELHTLFSQTQGLSWSFHANRSWFIYKSLASAIPGDPAIANIFAIALLGLLIILRQRLTGEIKNFLMMLMTIVAVFIMSVIFFPKDVWDYYLFGLDAIFAVIVAFSFTVIIKLIPRFGFLLVGVYLLLLVRPLDAVKGLVYPHFVGDAALYINQLSVVDYVYKEATGLFKYIVYTPPQYDYTWRYLFWWKDKRERRISETQAKEMFVIIEPDPGYPDRVRQWLKTRDQDGVTLREISFQGGIVVQVRRLGGLSL